MKIPGIIQSILTALLLLPLSSLASPAAMSGHPHGSAAKGRLPSSHDIEQWSPKALSLGGLPDLKGILPVLAESQVVFVGETHDQYGHHLSQLAIIRGLHRTHPDLVIAMEFFQQPYQAALDAFVAGEINETEMLRRTEYYDRWRFDYRLYQPILSYAREHRIPLIALNIPREITRKVAHEGLDGLSDEQRKLVPTDLNRDDEAYRERILASFRQHPGAARRNFENFFESQLLWDEGMAERAAAYLREHPAAHMVVLAGSGHLVYGNGIPDRLSRRLDVSTSIVLNGLQGGFDTAVADFLLFPKPVSLPDRGLLGIYMGDADEGVSIEELSADSAAQAAGLQVGDRILSVDGVAVRNASDVKLALWDKQPGEQVSVGLRRRAWVFGQDEMEFLVKLR